MDTPKIHDPRFAKALASLRAYEAKTGDKLRMQLQPAATIGPASQSQQANSPNQSGSSAPTNANQALPFTSSARRHREQMAIANATIANAGATFPATQIPEQAIPAYGFLRGLWLRVNSSTAGSGSGAVSSADGPFNFFSTISVTDPDGAPIYQVNSGYTAYLIHKYGGYNRGAGIVDPKLDNFYSGVNATTGNFQFQLWIPLEITMRNGLGALPNTDSGKQYKLNINTNASTVVYTTAPATTAPSLTITVFIDCWTQPPSQDVLGRNLTRVPPLVGTTQYWSRQGIPVNAGQSNGQTFGRVGNIVRGWIFVFRTTAGVRIVNTSGNIPTPATLYRDGYNYDIIELNNWLITIAQQYGLTAAADTAGGPDNGVLPYMFIFDLDGGPGNELRGQWWPTLQSSRIEIDGTYGVASTLEIITNDIAPTGDVSNRVLF
jgi:hypothetical protein